MLKEYLESREKEVVDIMTDIRLVNSFKRAEPLFGVLPLSHTQ